MSDTKDRVFSLWWPLPRSMDLVRAPIERAAEILESEWERIHRERARATWIQYPNVDAVFRSVETLAPAATTLIILPTHSEWSVLWDNSLGCDGWDSLCAGISRIHGIETLHWAAADSDGPLQAGSVFSLRKGGANGEPARSVYCCRNGSRWVWETTGDPLLEEDTELYERRQKKDRLNERTMMELLARLGAEPWREHFYRVREAPCFRLEARKIAKTNVGEKVSDVLSRGSVPPATSDEPPSGPPSYLRGHAVPPNPVGPAALLADGAWCGHGEPSYWTYDIPGEEGYEVLLGNESGTPGVTLRSPDGRLIVAYDGRVHPANAYFGEPTPPDLAEPLPCEACGALRFDVAVGFEVPSDAESENDTSWFALATRCRTCAHTDIVYDDETA